ncbi:unnamed protein product [Linum trigynum]|uniref:Reverse transcriptase domain-containing protein n=1 Tax=Linum trigynum TaxID=586398 RepID=A0AAV2ESH6_9ROSI
MDVLSFMLTRLKIEGKINGFFMNESTQEGEVIHLLFADDTLIFCESFHEQVLHITATLACLQAVTGLKINLEKSVLYIVGDVPAPNFFASIIGFKWSNQPPKYLGYPVGAKLNTNAFSDPIVNSYQKRLDSWSSRYLSSAGRLVLINSVLSSLEVYYFSLFKAPKTVINNLERVQRNFLWSGTDEIREILITQLEDLQSNMGQWRYGNL